MFIKCFKKDHKNTSQLQKLTGLEQVNVHLVFTKCSMESRSASNIAVPVLFPHS